ncbi:hypothetical protein [Zhihengliuella sp. ISTPL4]|uniref:hypothetical protein n=1 Tax=Zhihengliuella sp. ISTPL4 TaxID=2058657 RepID=UPI000C7BAAB3|nr:hypothetical protein [Zhihengliuella sp. ISTPL4]
MKDVHEDYAPGRRRVWLPLTILVVVVGLAVAAAFLVPPMLTPAEQPEPTSTPTVPPRDIVSTDAPRPTETPRPAPSESGLPFAELAPVEPDATIVAEGADILLARVEAVQGEAALAGETSGPAVRATVRIVNTGSEPLDLDYVAVNAYSGADRAPAGTLTRPGGVPFEGMLSPGDAAEGVYLFTIPEEDREDVTLTVDYLFGAEVGVFRGDLR